jgi:hypothetical protein
MSAMTSAPVEARQLDFRVLPIVLFTAGSAWRHCYERCRQGLSFYALAWSFSMSIKYCPGCGRRAIVGPSAGTCWSCVHCDSGWRIEHLGDVVAMFPAEPTPLFDGPKILDEIEQILTDAVAPKGVS